MTIQGDTLQKQLSSSSAFEAIESIQKQLLFSPALEAMESMQKQLASSTFLKSMESIQRQFASPKYFKAIESIQNQLASLPALNVMKSIQKQIISSPILKVLESIQQQILSEQTIKAIESIQKQLKPSSTMKAIESMQRQIASMPKLEAINTFQTQLSNSNFLESMKQELALANKFNSSFLAERLVEVHKLTEEENDNKIIKHLKILETNIINHIKILKPSKISYDGMLGIILTLLFFLYTQISQSKFEDKISNKLNSIKEITSQLTESQEKIYRSVSELLVNEDRTNTFFIVQRCVNLRTKPSTKSDIIIKLFPNQQVKLEKMKGKWLYISYFDFIDGVPKTGWVYKKYLKRIRS